MRYGGGLTLVYINEVAYFVSSGPIEWRNHIVFAIHEVSRGFMARGIGLGQNTS